MGGDDIGQLKSSYNRGGPEATEKEWQQSEQTRRLEKVHLKKLKKEKTSVSKVSQSVVGVAGRSMKRRVTRGMATWQAQFSAGRLGGGDAVGTSRGNRHKGRCRNTSWRVIRIC
ncbi:hypothetical protein PIB30_030556 [Stylosanthes scabra]|uniref:Uncharacterized protein n=1 Tax=Stylosanthes scabra TaxID=79078 RepID=A0ABU6SCE5_9FABA|nr:hypothetical protein [Stylosanthes scabra]